jgi:3-dehydroquinate synthase
MKRTGVRLGRNSYDICIGSGLLAQAGHLLKESGFSDKLVIITDTRVRGLYEKALGQSLTGEGFKIDILEVSEGEEQKSLETAGRLYSELSDLRAERTTPILALGGGVIGDLSGFVAATYMRGVPLVQVPTTLLAQVDSSIGGKVAVDHGRVKNKIGAFYQPRLVIADISILKSLSAKEISEGLAEVIKYAVIRDKEFFTFLEINLEQIKSLNEELLEEVVLRSAQIKAEIVEHDELDLGLRHILNYGHTVGHAIESVSDFKVGHGEAVALGMIAAGRISNKLGMLTRQELFRIEELIGKAGLPTKMPGLDVKKLMKAMEFDKKMAKGKIQFVLLRSMGEAFITDEVSPTLVEQVLVDWSEKA